MNELGKALIVVGIALALVGALLWAGFGKWLGRLPGDIHYTRGDSSFHFPIVTCLIISAVLSVVFWLFRRWQICVARTCSLSPLARGHYAESTHDAWNFS